jgi:hypothetical protein
MLFEARMPNDVLWLRGRAGIENFGIRKSNAASKHSARCRQVASRIRWKTAFPWDGLCWLTGTGEIVAILASMLSEKIDQSRPAGICLNSIGVVAAISTKSNVAIRPFCAQKAPKQPNETAIAIHLLCSGNANAAGTVQNRASNLSKQVNGQGNSGRLTVRCSRVTDGHPAHEFFCSGK